VIVADTSAIVALIDRDDRHHAALGDAFRAAWVLPWAILPEVDHIVATRLGQAAAVAFRADVASGGFSVEWHGDEDLQRAVELDAAYTDLRLGFVDAVVMATAERLEASAIATLDLRDFAPVSLRGAPALLPRDL
jgi:hypothetical protein